MQTHCKFNVVMGYFPGAFEGSDIDYTSDDTFLVQWLGFFDHESGIKSYIIGVANRCLNSTELNNILHTPDIDYKTECSFSVSSARIKANFTGKRFVSVIALNNVMIPSVVVCSDGITRDIFPPEIRNLYVLNAKWSASVVCHNGFPWLLDPSLVKVNLSDIIACKEMCNSHDEHYPIVSALPTVSRIMIDFPISESICSELRHYDENAVIYLPDDYLLLSWDVEQQKSEVYDFFVGIGSDPTEYTSPGVEDYKSTAGETFFKRQHEGIWLVKLFYVFIKAVNKAGLQKITTLGPILIDETPPLYKEIPSVEIIGENLIVGWENDTFYDMEQQEQINSVYFQIGR